LRYKFTVFSFLVLCAGALLLKSAETPGEMAALHSQFLHPPDDCRIMMRWWWFGPAVEKTELSRELHVMKDAGIGGVELQPVYPLELDDPQKGFRNVPYLSDAFLDNVRFTAGLARELGLRVDVTLGSGWPYGGPHTPITEAAGRLRCDHVAVDQAASSVPVPALENGEKLITAFLAPEMKQLSEIHNGRLLLPAGLDGAHTILFFTASRTGMQVKRASVGAEGFVLDHYDRSAIEHHLSAVAGRLLGAFGANPPHSVFSDSLEVFASDWTSDFLAEFQKRRGYDLTPYLPALVNDADENARAIRHDWGKTLTELADEHYLTPICEWAHQHHTLFRSQTYGEPPVILSSNALVDLPEGEMGPKWRGFSQTRWASSATHLYGGNITSSETWTWLHSPAFRATPLDMKAEADLHFLEGINQLVGHGWPYSPPSAGEPGWRFYAAAAFNDHNPWFAVMPEITKYLQRMSFLMRQGKPANDIAIYLPTDDAWAGFRLGKVSVDRSMDQLLGPNLIPEILDAGYDFDFIDDGAIAKVGVPYRALILPGVERIPLATLEKLSSYVKNGGVVIATRRLPGLAPGFLDAKNETARIREQVRQLFDASNKNAQFIQDERGLPEALTQRITPDFAIGTAGAGKIGFIHRKLPDGDLYFVANTSNEPVNTDAIVRIAGAAPQAWNPFTGEISPIAAQPAGQTTKLRLNLAPYESRVIVFDKATAHYTVVRWFRGSLALDLSSGWNVTFPELGETEQMQHLTSWTDNERTRYYSGRAIYEKSFVLPEGFSGSREVIDFGPGTPVPPPPPGPGMRALLESPVRECAVVFVNGQRAGSVWHPPYELDVTKFLRAGKNQIRLVVANLAINEMAGRSLPDYRLLNLRYGERFVPQGYKDLHPLPSGILGSVTLKTERDREVAVPLSN
jgi:hypothetical protein